MQLIVPPVTAMHVLRATRVVHPENKDIAEIEPGDWRTTSVNEQMREQLRCLAGRVPRLTGMKTKRGKKSQTVALRRNDRPSVKSHPNSGARGARQYRSRYRSTACPAFLISRTTPCNMLSGYPFVGYITARYRTDWRTCVTRPRHNKNRGPFEPRGEAFDQRPRHGIRINSEHDAAWQVSARQFLFRNRQGDAARLPTQ
jgi:hypothetical protein